MTKLFFAAILLIISLTLGFSFDKRTNKSTLSLETPNCNICDSVEVRGLVTIDGIHSTDNRMPVDSAYIDIYLEEDAGYVCSIIDESKIDNPAIKNRRVSNYTTDKKGIFSFKLAKGKYFLVFDNNDKSVSNPYYFYFHIDGEEKIIDLGEVKLHELIIIVGFDDSEFFNRKIIREKRKKR